MTWPTAVESYAAAGLFGGGFGLGESELRQRAARARRAARPGFEPVVSKLFQPLMRPGMVSRPDLVERLAADPRPIVSVVAAS